jgi:hypothetical protein
MSRSIELHILNALGLKSRLLEQSGRYCVQPNAITNPELAVWSITKPNVEVSSPSEVALIFANYVCRFELEQRDIGV